jgi:hypothetical protein
MEIYISEIAERLWSGHASLMIGAGFSMNAKKSEATTKKFPAWNELGDCFYQKLYGKESTNEDKCYLDVLKLANEVESTFGRPALNKILRDTIPNMEYQPSELHENLLQLPWVDIFTTNYDTLLERTAEKVLEQRYETIINKEDLVWSTKPRIIKLHGSFPSDRPFIITEEDYRQYPKEYAPFVNTVQQSLLENTLCLIGFSGNDPNFQKWTGWIRDNLGKEKSLKIYLIGKLSLSVGQKKLLEERNIVPIDLSCYSDKHYDALKEFVDKIKEYGKKEDQLDWGDNSFNGSGDDNNDINDKLNKIVSRWKLLRLSYPNWLILPEQKRDGLKIHTETELNILYKAQSQNILIPIEFLYELNWRQEKYLMPIYNDWIEMYENVLSRYNPYPTILQVNDALIPNDENEYIEWKDITSYWVELQLALLRVYREENFLSKWNALAEKIEKIKDKLSPELTARYCYERCLYYLFLLDIISVRKELANWTCDTTLPYWEAKKAGLMAELGDVEEAVKILETSLNEIRNRLRLSPVTNDYSLVSQEAYILQLSRYVKRSLNYTQGKYFSETEEIKEYSERWTELIKYKCDPWGELKSFESILKAENPKTKQIEEKYGFGIGQITKTHHLSKNTTYTAESYMFLRYMEETGIPFKLACVTFGKEAAQKATACIANYSPHWGFVSFIRTGESKMIDGIFNRRSLAFMTQQKCDELAMNYLEVLIKSASEIEKGNTYNNTIFAISLSTVIPLILSRLCVKCRYDVKIKILNFVKNLYLADIKVQTKYGSIDKLIKQLLYSFSKQEQYDLLSELLKFPIHPESDRENPYPDVFAFLHLGYYESQNKIKIEAKTIDELTSYLSDGNVKRKLSITRLIVLWKCGLLTKTQQNKFGVALWKTTDENGFPKDTDYYYFSFLKFPYPQNIKPQEILRKYFNKTEFPIESNKEKGCGISMERGNYPLFYDILGTSDKQIDYKWDKKEFNKLVLNIIEWWNADKEYLKETENHFMGGSIADEFRSRFRNMINIFSNLISMNTELLDSILLVSIETLLNELRVYDMPNLEAKASFIKVFPQDKNDLYAEISRQLYSKNKDEILDAVNAISVLVEQYQENINYLIENVSENLKCRTEISLYRYIDSIGVILDKNSKLLTNKILNNIQVGFEFLYDEICINNDDTEDDVQKKLVNQRSGSHLLVALKKHYTENLKEDLPGYITKWETKCLDTNEFAEIRNIWINKIK